MVVRASAVAGALVAGAAETATCWGWPSAADVETDWVAWRRWGARVLAEVEAANAGSAPDVDDERDDDSGRLTPAANGLLTAAFTGRRELGAAGGADLASGPLLMAGRLDAAAGAVRRLRANVDSAGAGRIVWRGWKRLAG